MGEGFGSGGGCPPDCGGGNKGNGITPASMGNVPGGYDGAPREVEGAGVDDIAGEQNVQGINLKGDSYSPSLPVSGSVTLGGGGNGMKKSDDFNRLMLRNQPWRADGPIQMMGSPGDPFGIWQGLGMILSSSGSNLQYAAIPLLVIKGQGDDALKIIAAERGLWSSTNNMSSAKNAFSHFKKHGSEFPEFGNALQYRNSAHNFMNNSPAGTLLKNRSNGDVLKYHPSSNTFGVKNSGGALKTMCRPKDGIDYWLKQ